MMLNLTKEEVTNIIRIYVENNFDVYKIKLIRGTDYSNIPEVTVELEDVK